MVKRKKRPFFVERLDNSGYWGAALDGQEFDDAAAATKALRNSGLSGPYRIVSVVWAGEVHQEQVVRPRLTEWLPGA